MRELAALVAIAVGSLTAAALRPEVADAAPAADLVVIWAPGANTTPVQAAVRRAGAALIDRSPAAQAPPAIAAIIQRGIAAYDALRFDDASVAFEEARGAVDRTGAAGLDQSQLADLFLYRGLVRAQQADASAAWDDLVTAATIEPTRVLDPARFAPRVIADFDRARAAITSRPLGNLTIDAPGCTTVIDGNAVVPRIEPKPVAAGSNGAATGLTGDPGLVVGPHWVHVDCADRPPWGTRVELTASADLRLTPRSAPFAPPTDDEVLIQARTSGARAFIVAEVRAGVAMVRLIGVDGHERDRRSIAVTTDLVPLAAAIEALLAPPRERTHWYRTQWAWAAGAAVIVAAIVIPITAAASGSRAATTGTIKVPSTIWSAP